MSEGKNTLVRNPFVTSLFHATLTSDIGSAIATSRRPTIWERRDHLWALGRLLAGQFALQPPGSLIRPSIADCGIRIRLPIRTDATFPDLIQNLTH